VTNQSIGPSTDSFLSLLAYVEELIDAGRIRDARRFLAQFIERKQPEPRMLPALASLYLRVGKSEQALATMRLAITELGGEASLFNALGLMLASIGKEEESREQFEEALKLDPTNNEALRNLAFTLHRSGQRRRSYGLLIECAKASPLSVELRLICGTLLELDGRLHDAAVCYREVVELSTVAQQIRLASQRLLFLNASVGATDGFEDVIAKLVEEGEKEEGNR
jgi:tetratricopeptide (TPR) repeat protein